MKIAKEGDRIKWSVSEDHPDERLSGKTFEAIVETVSVSNVGYGVHAEYGTDIISHSHVKEIYPNSRSYGNPHKCPVCDGTGKVPNGFYLRVGVNEWSTSSLTPETCRSCNGTGIVWG